MSPKARAKTKPKKKLPTNPDRTIINLETPAQEISPATAADLRSSGYNPRSITPEKLQMLKKAMQEYGDLGGVVFNRTTGRLVSGHQRGKNLDPKWPIIKQDHTDATGTVAIGHVETPEGRFAYREVAWDEKKEKGANVAANQQGGEFDDDLLAQLLQDLNKAGYDMDLLGFDDAELKELLGSQEEDNLGEEDPEVIPVEDPFVQLGDLWVMGESRLLVGDSTSIADVDRLMMGDKADLVVTDPPYGVAYEGTAGKILNDNLNEAKLKEFLLAVFACMHHALKPGGCLYVYHAEGGNLGNIFRSALSETKGIKQSMPLVWVKSSSTLGRSDYNPKHEPILYGWREGAAHWFIGDFTLTTVIDDDVDISKMDKKSLQNLVNELRGREPSSVIRVDKPHKSPDHPTQKPLRLFEKNVYASSRPGEIVLDLFSGSGTLIMTCRKIGRRGRAMEMDPRYAQASLTRYINYCGEEPLLLLPDGKTVTFSEAEKQRKATKK